MPSAYRSASSRPTSLFESSDPIRFVSLAFDTGYRYAVAARLFIRERRKNTVQIGAITNTARVR
jgi:hypothetical protein